MEIVALGFRYNIGEVVADEVLRLAFQGGFQFVEVVFFLVGRNHLQPIEQAGIPHPKFHVQVAVVAGGDAFQSRPLLVQVWSAEGRQRDVRQLFGGQVFALGFQHKGVAAGNQEVRFALRPIQRGQERFHDFDGAFRQVVLIAAPFQVLLKIVEIEQRRVFDKRSTEECLDFLVELHLPTDDFHAIGASPTSEHLTQFLPQVYPLQLTAQDNQFHPRETLNQFPRQAAFPDPRRSPNQESIFLVRAFQDPDAGLDFASPADKARFKHLYVAALECCVRRRPGGAASESLSGGDERLQRRAVGKNTEEWPGVVSVFHLSPRPLYRFINPLSHRQVSVKLCGECGCADVGNRQAPTEDNRNPLLDHVVRKRLGGVEFVAFSGRTAGEEQQLGWKVAEMFPQGFRRRLLQLADLVLHVEDGAEFWVNARMSRDVNDVVAIAFVEGIRQPSQTPGILDPHIDGEFLDLPQNAFLLLLKRQGRVRQVRR